MTNTLTRVYNSTLGVPQQALYRLWRALKEDDVDVFSREGLLAPELLPVLGIAASHESDVDVTELIGDQGFGVNLAADILLDPATYLTAGATAAAKAAKATNIAVRAKKGGKATGAFLGDMSQYETAGDLANKFAEGLSTGALAGKGPESALKNLEAVADSLLKDVLASGRQEEALFTLPGLSLLGAKKRAPEFIQQQGSWWKAMNNLVYKRKLGLQGPLDYTVAQAANKLRQAGPLGQQLTENITTIAGIPGALKAGLTTKKRAAFATDLKDVTEDSEQALEFLSQHSDTIKAAEKIDLDNFQARYNLELGQGKDPLDAALKTLASDAGGRVRDPHRFLDELLPESTDPEAFGAELVSSIQDLTRKAEAASASASKSKSVTELKQGVPEEIADDPLQSFMYKKGQWLRGVWRKGFVSDAPFESEHLEEYLKGRDKMAGMGRSASEAAIPVIRDAKQRIAKSGGLPVEALDEALDQFQNGYPAPQDLIANLDAFNSGDIGAAQAGLNNLRNYQNQLLSASTAFQKVTGTRVFDELIDVLGTEGRVVGTNVDPWVVRLADVARPEGVQDLLGKPLQTMSSADIKRLRAATDDPTLKSRLKNAEKRGIPETKLKTPTKAGKELQGLGKTAGDYMLAVKDMERALSRTRKGDRLFISPPTVGRLDKGFQEIRDAFRESIHKAYPKADPKDIERILGYSDLAAQQAMPFGRGAPIAYVPRQTNPKFQKALGELIGKAAKVLPGDQEVTAMQRRVRDRNLTIEDLNELMDRTDAAKAPEISKAMRELVGEIPAKRYQEGWEVATLSRLSDQAQQFAHRDLVNNVFSNPAAAAQDGLQGGRVTRIFQHPERRMGLGVTKKTYTGKKSSNVNTVEHDVNLTPELIEIQQPDGKFRMVDLRELEDMGVDVQIFGKEGDTLGDAVVRHDGMHGARRASEELEHGSWLMTGQNSALQSLRQTVIPQKGEMAGILGAYDTLNFGIKKFQTVFRFSHHAGNLVSNIAQTRAAGASFPNTMLAHVDTLRLISDKTDEGEKFWAELAARTGVEASSSSPLGKPAQLVESVEALAAGVAAKDLPEFLVLNNGVQQYGGLEIVERALQRNLYGSIQASEDIRLGGSLSGEQIQKQVDRSGGKVDTLMSATKAPEFFARTTTVMALLREGHGLDDAVDMARLAHVDYSDLTKFERTWLKRMIPFYTFSRKYTPFALGRMAKDPSLIGPWVKSIQQSGSMGIDENGKPIISAGGFEADLGRLNANVDALMAMAGVAESLGGGLSNDVQAIQGPGFASFSGGAASVVLGAVNAGSDGGASLGGAASELWDSVFITRFIEAAAAGDGDALGDSALSWLIPAKFNAEPERARKFQLNMARRGLQRLELRAQEATSQAQLDSLRAQAQELRTAIRNVQRDFR